MSLELTVPKPRTLEAWGIGWRRIVAFHGEFRYRIGQYLVEGEQLWGDKIYQYIDPSHLDPRYIDNAKWLYRAIPESEYEAARGIKDSTWAELASFKPEERNRLIGQINAGAIGRAELRALKHGEKNGKVLEPVESNPLVDALLLVGRLLSREAQGENVEKLLLSALAELIALAGARRQSILGVGIDADHEEA